MSSISSHFKWTALGKLAAQLISWSSTIIVIRFLTPEDYGLVALASILIGFATLIGELGLTAAIIQDKNITKQKIKETQGLVACVYILLTILCIIGAPYFAKFYHSPELTNIIIVLSVQFLLLALTSVDFALLQKNLDFKNVALIQMVANTSGAIITLTGAALLNLQVWAIITGTLTIFTVNAIGYRMNTKRKFLWEINIKNSMEYLKFGGSMSVQRIFSYINGQASSIITGKALGAESLGTLSIARELASLTVEKITPIFTSVLFPLFSQMESKKEKEKIFYSCAKLLYIVILPSCWGIAVTAQYIVPIILGESWESIIPYLEILAFSAPLPVISFLYSPIMYACGDKKTPVYNTATLTLLTLASTSVGIQWGIYGVCIGLAVTGLLYSLISTRQFEKSTGIQSRGVILALKAPVAASLLMCTAVLVCKKNIHFSNSLMLTLLSFIGAITYLATVLIIDKKIFHDVKKFIKG